MTDLHKKALYLSSHRGTKEADHIIGSFVKNFLMSVDPGMLPALCDFLYEDDDKIMAWGKCKEASPQQFIEIIKSFRQWLVTLEGSIHG
ncbi:MAG: succinate dehydrogenase assembly factor 2 [Alphaproteobacteria bacterium]|nr:succinate dehydrogenase assembly factor 2 [Alphaproteobacteria bacterium]OJV47134.1 MAG: hypothetical protein BGO28_01680 [Alphaproteobacteria bacterium 43-37]